MAQDKKPGRPAAKKTAPAKKAARKTASAKKPATQESKPRKRAAPKPAGAPTPEQLQGLAQVMTPAAGKPKEPPPKADEPMGEAMRKLTEKQRTFVREYLTDLNATQAAIRAGYSEKTAAEIGHENLRKPQIAAAIKEEQDGRLKRLEIDGDDVVKRWHQVAFADANELSQHRRVCCRHCHGIGFGYQYTPGEFRTAKAKHEMRRLELQSKGDIGDFPGVEGDWYDKRRAPHQHCPECFGEGVPEVWLPDTRHLSPAARALYAGTKEGKDGIEVKAHDQQRATEYLARHLGLFNDKLEVNATVSQATAEELDRFYEEARAKSEDAAAKVRGRGDRIRASMPKP